MFSWVFRICSVFKTCFFSFFELDFGQHFLLHFIFLHQHMILLNFFFSGKFVLYVYLICNSSIRWFIWIIFYHDCLRWGQDAEYIVEPGDKIIICCVRVIKFLLFIGKKYSENFALILRTFALFTRKVTRLLFIVFISQTARVKPQKVLGLTLRTFQGIIFSRPQIYREIFKSTLMHF